MSFEPMSLWIYEFVSWRSVEFVRAEVNGFYRIHRKLNVTNVQLERRSEKEELINLPT